MRFIVQKHTRRHPVDENITGPGTLQLFGSTHGEIALGRIVFSSACIPYH